VRPARRPEVVRELSFAQAAHPAFPPLAVSLVVAVLTALVLPLRRVWPGPVFAVMVLERYLRILDARGYRGFG
jgi:hypothetical protein